MPFYSFISETNEYNFKLIFALAEIVLINAIFYSIISKYQNKFLNFFSCSLHKFAIVIWKLHNPPFYCNKGEQKLIYLCLLSWKNVSTSWCNITVLVHMKYEMLILAPYCQTKNPQQLIIWQYVLKSVPLCKSFCWYFFHLYYLILQFCYLCYGLMPRLYLQNKSKFSRYCELLPTWNACRINTDKL